MTFLAVSKPPSISAILAKEHFALLDYLMFVEDDTQKKVFKLSWWGRM